MFFRHSRWLVASLAAIAGICLSPGRSNADVQILVEELNSGGTVIAGSSQSTILTGSGVMQYTSGTFFTGQATVSTNSGTTPVPAVASLIPGFTGELTNNFNVAQGNMLRIMITDNGFQAKGPNGSLKVQVSGSTGFANGTESITESTRIFDPITNTTILSVPNLVSPDGTLQQQIVSTQGLTSPFAIQQTLTISFSGAIPADATFGSTGGASLTSAAVPAPGGLALALIGLPLIGIRRALRRRVPATLAA